MLDGHYKVTGTWHRVILVKGDSAVMKETELGDLHTGLNYGEFGEVDHKISEITNESNTTWSCHTKS